MLKSFAVLKKLTCVAALLGYLMPHHGFSNIFSEKLSLTRTFDEEEKEQNLYLSSLKTGLISSSILSLFGQGNRKSILASGLISSGFVLTRDFLEKKANPFLDNFSMNFIPHKSYCLYELTVGLVSGLFVHRLFKNKKWGTVFGILEGSSCGMIEALFGDKIGLNRIVFSINGMSSSFTEKIDELYKKIDNIVRHVAKEVQNDLADNKSKTKD